MAFDAALLKLNSGYDCPLSARPKGMPLDAAKADLVIQFALLLAGEEDSHQDRMLGPIHLLKYVYLADLAYARQNSGQTFTGADWSFYHFGPWAPAVHSRIEPALKAVQADKREFPSDYEDRKDWVRWSKTDDELLQRIRSDLPSNIRLELQSAVHRYRHDTTSLLHHVYTTAPMLQAAPGEAIDFSLEKPFVAPPKLDDADALTARQQKKLREGMRELAARRAARLAARPKLVKPEPPRYDEMYEEGLRQLEELAGKPFKEELITVEFDDSVWKSPTRNGHDLS